MSRYFKTPNGYAVLVGFINYPSAIPFIDGWIPNLEDAKWMVDKCGEFRKLICEKGSLTTSTIVDGWIQTIEVNCDFSKDDDCTIHNGDFVCEQSMIEDREGYCHIPIFRLTRIEKSVIVFHCIDNFNETYDYSVIVEKGKEEESIANERRYNTEIDNYEVIRGFINND